MSRERRILLLGNGQEIWQKMFQILHCKRIDVQKIDLPDISSDCCGFDIIVVCSEIFESVESGDLLLPLVNPNQHVMIVGDCSNLDLVKQQLPSINIHYMQNPCSASSIVSKIVDFCDIDGMFTRSLKFENVVEYCSNQRRDLILDICSGSNRGRIYFEQGRAVHAKTEDNFGNKAFSQMQFWQPINYQISPLNAYVIHSLNGSAVNGNDSLMSRQLQGQRSYND